MGHICNNKNQNAFKTNDKNRNKMVSIALDIANLEDNLGRTFKVWEMDHFACSLNTELVEGSYECVCWKQLYAH